MNSSFPAVISPVLQRQRRTRQQRTTWGGCIFKIKYYIVHKRQTRRIIWIRFAAIHCHICAPWYGVLCTQTLCLYVLMTWRLPLLLYGQVGMNNPPKFYTTILHACIIIRICCFFYVFHEYIPLKTEIADCRNEHMHVKYNIIKEIGGWNYRSSHSRCLVINNRCLRSRTKIHK